MNNIKPLASSDLAKIITKYSPYAKEVRKRVFVTLSIFAVATVLGFFYYENIIRLLIRALSLEGINIVFTSPFQFINLAVSCGVVTGLIVAFPVFVFQVLYFLKPALKRKEFVSLTRLLPFSLILFLIGFTFGALIMKWQIEIFLNRAVSLGIGNILDISGLLSTVFVTSALMGIGFQFPIVLLLFLRIGLIQPRQLRKYRRWVYLGSFMFALLLPPDSILADIILSLPLIILFEFTLILHKTLNSKDQLLETTS